LPTRKPLSEEERCLRRIFRECRKCDKTGIQYPPELVDEIHHLFSGGRFDFVMTTAKRLGFGHHLVESLWNSLAHAGVMISASS